MSALRPRRVPPYAWLLLLAAALAAYWLLPIAGTVAILPRGRATLAPTFRLEPLSPEPRTQAAVYVTDTEPWAFVTLTVDGQPAEPVGQAVQHGKTWTWHWLFDVPERAGYTLAFYHDCHVGCVARGSLQIGLPESPSSDPLLPTKLGVVLPSPSRDWHGRSAWAVELSYARQAEAAFWGVDDLAARVAVHRAQGLRVLVRVDYDEGQSIPPAGDLLALSEYLSAMERLARDDRLEGVYGYIIGNDFNSAEANRAAADRLVDPAWYARVFNGYGEDPARSDNVVQTVRAANPLARVLVGPVRPWAADQDGELAFRIDAPWLNYMNTLVAHIDEAARLKAAEGYALALPDGFDVQAPGSPDAPELAGALRQDEPRTPLPRAAWNGAQAGFQVYRDWMEIINAYPAMHGLPIYIISTNTYDRLAGIPPAQNYPSGWLTAALEVADAEPQVVALCWFLDEFPHSDQWDWFSLARRLGRLADAADEFDRLLRAE